jgi:eukaryotic-like serine/threonine-protein kinase
VLIAGTKLGPYEIVAPLGSGGMGEVYRARDPRLGREVAIKVVPESFASDPNRLRRFEQEARAVGALNHPNILSVHDTGVQNGTHYIVTELLDGATLREKLSTGPLPPRRATEYAMQIAQGLAAAHETGFVHRDLKPENLFITKAGRVKILDFGLAKQSVTALRGGADDITFPTAQTSAGVVLGTVAYMSPEQVRGETIDHRTDIFAFGVVLYEMLTGQRAFHRNSSAETMAAILKEDLPEIASTGERQISPTLQRIVHRCLEKDPGQRFQSTKDLNFALESATTSTGAAEVSAAGHAQPSNGWRTASLTLGVLLLGVVALVVLGFLSRVSQPEYKQITFRRGPIDAARFAREGQAVVYSAAWDHPPAKLYTSRADGTEVRGLDLAGDVAAVSRLGELAVISEKGTLVRVPLGGGAPREVLDDVTSADWSPDGAQLAVARVENGKSRLEYPIGKPLYETIGWITHLRISPQGDAIAFMDHPFSGDDRGTLAVVDLKGNRRSLTSEWTGEQGLAWSPDGSEVWFTATNTVDSERNLYAVSRAGKQRLVLRSPGGVWLEDIASDGRMLLTHQDRRYEVTVTKIGGETRQLSWLEIMLGLSMSRDGKFAVIGDWGGSGGTDYRIYLAKLDGSPAVLLGSGIGGGISPDNKRVTSILPSDTTKVLLLPTGIGETTTVAAPNFRYRSADWASDGHTLVMRASESGKPLRFWVQNIDGSAPRPVTPEGTDDGLFLTIRHIDYVCARDAAGIVRLYPIDGGEPKAVAGVNKAEQVIGASPDSDIIYVSTDSSAVARKIVKVNVTTGQRQPFVTVSPNDPAGVLGLFQPIFTPDEKQYVETQVREFSVLFVATGLK